MNQKETVMNSGAKSLSALNWLVFSGLAMIVGVALLAWLFRPLDIDTSFERFATEYAADLETAHEDIQATFVSHDVRTTTSLTAPYAGVASYQVTKPLVYRDRSLQGYETEAVFDYEVRIEFAGDGDAWLPVETRCKILDVRFPDLSQQQLDQLGPYRSLLKSEFFTLSINDPLKEKITTAPLSSRVSLAEWKKMNGIND